MVWWLWAIFGLVLVIAEILMPAGFFLLFFGVGAFLLAIAVATLPEIPVGVQWLIFAGLGPALVFGLRPLKGLLPEGPKGKNDRDTMVGDSVTVAENIAPDEEGHVDYRGSRWLARNVGSAVLSPGDPCIIDSVENLTLRVKRR